MVPGEVTTRPEGTALSRAKGSGLRLLYKHCLAGEPPFVYPLDGVTATAVYCLILRASAGLSNVLRCISSEDVTRSRKASPGRNGGCAAQAAHGI